MVDSINGSGGPQNLTQINRNQNAKTDEKRAEKAETSDPVDEVSVSDEAQALQAEETAKDTRTLLEQQLEAYLSPEGGRKLDKLL